MKAAASRRFGAGAAGEGRPFDAGEFGRCPDPVSWVSVRVKFSIALRGDPVGAGTAAQGVVARAAAEGVVAGQTVEDVVADGTGEGVVARGAGALVDVGEADPHGGSVGEAAAVGDGDAEGEDWGWSRNRGRRCR